MRVLISSVFFIYLTLQCCKCDFPIETYPFNGLTGSSLVPAGPTPYQVAIMRKVEYHFEVIDGLAFVCSGSLIAAQWVLTAAQCVQSPKLRIILGAMNIQANERTQIAFQVDEENIIVHPNYKEGVMDNDVALIKLPEPVEYNYNIQPVPLASDNSTYFGSAAYLSSWGRVNSFMPVSTYMRRFVVKVIPNKVCQSNFSQPFVYIKRHHMCTTEGDWSNPGGCGADSGAPLVSINRKNSRPEQVGVVSRPQFFCRGSEPTIYSRVSWYRNWIDLTIGEGSDNRSEEVVETIEGNGVAETITEWRTVKATETTKQKQVTEATKTTTEKQVTEATKTTTEKQATEATKTTTEKQATEATKTTTEEQATEATETTTEEEIVEVTEEVTETVVEEEAEEVIEDQPEAEYETIIFD